MSSSASAVNSLSSSSGTYFNGLSNYSQDLNNAITREVEIASLPIQLLQNSVSTLQSQTSELQTLQNDFTSVQTAISGISSAAGSILSPTVADPSVASATVDSTATAGTYSLEVDNLGSYSNALSVDKLPTVTDPTSQSISSSNSFTLTVNGTTIQPPITPSGTSLDDLTQAINNANAGVEATVVNVGSSSSPDYRLSLQSSQYGDVDMQLYDGSQNLLAASGSAGQPVQYIVDGKSVSGTSRNITLAPGVTVNLTGTDQGAPTTVTVAPDTSGVGSALQSFVTAYNSAISELGNNRGQNTGALNGDSIIYEMTDVLQGVANYASGGSQIPSLAELGVSFNDDTGQLSFDQSTFNSATSGQSDALSNFLGSATGGGFLESATNALTSILDPNTGILTTDMNTTQSAITSTNQQITSEQNQVNTLQTNLTTQMSAADATIYSMEQQQSYLQSMFTAQQDAENAGVS
jgi:flagellar hook-associated protein 2